MMPSPTDREQTLREQIATAMYSAHGGGMLRQTCLDLADAALSTLSSAITAAERRGEQRGLERAARIALSERGQIAGCPERDDLCGDLAQRYRALTPETTDDE